MTKFLIYALFFLYVCMPQVQPKDVDNTHEWDLLIFTQSWPPTVCLEWEKQDPKHTCNLPPGHDLWTIHGIWPTKLKTMGPAFCNRTWHFDPEEVRPIEDRLEQLWTNVETGTSTYALWAHEWNKHGTCAAVLEPLNSQLKYFTMGLNWEHKFFIHDILNEASIVPSNDNQYSVLDIHNAIKTVIGVNPVIECRKEDSKSYLAEIRICFSKTMELHDCDGVLNIKPTMFGREPVLTNCNISQGVIYLPYQSNKLYVQLYKLVMWLQWMTL